MILELDAGNPRIKWRQLDAETNSVSAEGNAADVSELAQSLHAATIPEMIRMCSVRGTAENSEITQWVSATWKLENFLQPIRVYEGT